MLEAYTNLQALASGQNLPLSSITIEKGCTATVSGDTVKLNKCGVYAVHLDAYGYTTATAGLIGFQLVKNGVPQPQAISESYSGTADNAGVRSVAFDTLVSVPVSNKQCCPCSEPTVLNFRNAGNSATWSHVNITVTKVC